VVDKLILKDAFKGYTQDLDKLVSPGETLRRFRERLRAVDLDILEGTVRIDNGRLDIPVYFSLCGRDAREVIGTKKQMGKGGTPEQSEASAVMELAERFSFFSFCKEPKNFRLDTYRNVRREAIAFEDIAKSVHDGSSEPERVYDLFSEIPLKWTQAYDLTQGRSVLIPFDWFFAINEFNGPCAGNGVEEAILQGICEVVERHVSSIISRERLRTPSIDLDSSKDPLARELVSKYRRAGIRLYATDFSLNTGIPSVGVLAHDPATFPHKSELVWTAGTTPNPEKSLIRALTEVAQLGGDFNSGSNYVASGLPKFTSLAEADFVTGAQESISIDRLPDLSHNNMRVEVEGCVEALRGIGLEVLLIDVTHPGLRIPAYYTIVPGAHFRERAAGTSVGMFLAKLISEKDDPVWAYGQLQRMDERLPGKYFLKFYLGSVSLKTGDPETASRHFEEALGLAPNPQDIPSIYSYLAVCLKELERYREAIVVLDKARRLDPDRTDVHNLMGFCHFKLKEHPQAIECFRRVLEINPGSAIDYANIASNYRDMGNRDEAIRYYRLALELDPSIDFARDNLERLGGGRLT
jgi:ribosomal protein S12 methylthiotransferase accessory factor